MSSPESVRGQKSEGRKVRRKGSAPSPEDSRAGRKQGGPPKLSNLDTLAENLPANTFSSEPLIGRGAGHSKSAPMSPEILSPNPLSPTSSTMLGSNTSGGGSKVMSSNDSSIVSISASTSSLVNSTHSLGSGAGEPSSPKIAVPLNNNPPPALRSAGIFQKQFFFQISVPGGEDSDGPWEEDFDSSPAIVPKPMERNTVDIMTVSEVIMEKQNDTLKECRRIQIYQHKTEAPRWDLPSIQKYLIAEPERSLVLVEPFLKSPKTNVKFFSKVLSIEEIKDFQVGSDFLQPLFGSWLNPAFAAEAGLECSSALVYLVEYCLEHGTVVRPLKPPVTNFNRNQLREFYIETVHKAIESCIAHHPGKGFSLAIVTPLARKGHFSSQSQISLPNSAFLY